MTIPERCGLVGKFEEWELRYSFDSKQVPFSRLGAQYKRTCSVCLFMVLGPTPEVATDSVVPRPRSFVDRFGVALLQLFALR